LTPLAAASVVAVVSTNLVTKEKLVSNAEVDAIVAEEGIESSELLSTSRNGSIARHNNDRSNNCKNDNVVLRQKRH
jgi:DNA-directed RNA polymerase subunit H (RpoH/RPB5)